MHQLLVGHDCTTAQKSGWRGENEYDLFITSDQNVRYQQNLTGRKIAILELSTNDLHRIQLPRVSSKEQSTPSSQAIF
jgi:hypothetical protein